MASFLAILVLTVIVNVTYKLHALKKEGKEDYN
jgi:hypothetical protein